MPSIEEEFREKIKDLKEYIILASVEAKLYQEANLEIIKYLTQTENVPGVYVSLNKPYNIVKASFDKKGIDTRLIIFIDAVTETAKGKTEKTKNCLFIGDPTNLSDISLAMDQAVTALPGDEKFLFFDSLSTLLIYNHINTVARFIHFLSTKMRVWKVKGIIISLQKESDKELISELSQFCDATLEIGGEK